MNGTCRMRARGGSPRLAGAVRIVPVASAEQGGIRDPDAALVASARGGDYAAFERLAGKYERSIHTLARRIVRNVHDAEEVVQETFLSVVRNLKRFREDASFRTWLVRIATNHALKVLRRRRTHPAASLNAGGDDDAPLPHPEFIAEWRDDPQRIARQRETRRLLEDALAKVDDKYRLVFLLRDVEGLSTEETADALGISVANTKVRLMRARLMLREMLTRHFGDERKRLAPHSHDEGTDM